MLAERIEWYTACINNDAEFISSRLEEDAEIYAETVDAINEHNARVKTARTMGTQPPLVAPYTEKTRFLNVVDDRLTDFSRNVISGFTGLMYACYFDSYDVFQLLFEYEYRRTSVFEVNVHATANTKTSRFVLPIESNVLMLALLRSSRNCLRVILDKIAEDEEYRRFFYGQTNRDGYNCLSIAALVSTSQYGSDFITANTVRAMILPNAACTSGFFHVCCYYGQYTALNKVYEILEDEDVDPSLKKDIYTALLLFDQESGLLEACEKKIDYYNYVSSYDLKVECYNLVATMLEEALVALVNYRGKTYDQLRTRWAASTVKYYRLLPQDEQVAQEDVENVEEVAIRYVEPLDQRLEKWFSCQDVKFVQQNLTELRRQMDERDQSYEDYIYNKFMLIHYSLLFDADAVFELIYEHERQIGVEQATTIRLSNQELSVPENTTVMELAVLLNAQRCVQRFVDNVNKGTWSHELSVNDQSETLLMTCCQVKNEAARAVWECDGVVRAELDYIDRDDPRKNVFQRAIECDNVYVLDKLVQLAGNPEYTPVVFVVVLAYRRREPAGFEAGAIARYLTRMGLNYIQKASAVDVDRIMDGFLTSEEWAQKKQDWDLLRQCVTGNYAVGETEEQEEALLGKRLELVYRQAEQQLFCLLSYQSRIFSMRPYNREAEGFVAPKKVIWFDICFGGDQVAALAPMCLKYRDPRPTDVEGRVTFRNFTGLMYAIMGNNTAAIRYLLPYEYMETLVEDEQVMTRFGTFLLRKGATALHLACAVSDEKNYRLVQQFYATHGEFSTDVPGQTVSALSIIFGRPLAPGQLEHDLPLDDNLLRFAVQNMSLEHVERVAACLQNRRLRQAAARNCLRVFESNFEPVGCYDVAVESFYSNLDDVTIQIRDAVKRALTALVRENDDQITADVAGWFLDPPRADDDPERRRQAGRDIITELQQLKHGQPLLEPDRAAAVVDERFCELDPEADDLAGLGERMRRRTDAVSRFNFNPQTELQTDWFNSCRGNQMDNVRKVSYMFAGSQDQRPTDLQQMTQQGFTGLMYGVCYGNAPVVAHLAQQEASVLTTAPTVFQYNGRVFYVPRASSALHLAVLVANQDFIVKLLDSDRNLFFEFNEARITPFQLMVERGYMIKEFFTMFVNNLTEYQFNMAVENMFKAQNKEFAQFLIENHQTKIQEPLYELVFKICKEIKDQGSGADVPPCEDALRVLEEPATLYALQQLNKYKRDQDLCASAEQDGDSEECVWKDLLEEKYGDEYKAAYKEYVDYMEFKESGEIVIEEEKIIANYMRIENDEWIVEAPEKLLLLTEHDKDMICWFDLCKSGTIEEVRAFIKDELDQKGFNVVGQRDTRNNNVEKEIFKGFTGLMYAAYADNYTVVQELLLFEGAQCSEEKNVIKAQILTYPTQVQDGESDSEPSKEVFNFLTNKNLNIVGLILMRGSIRTFEILYNYDKMLEFLADDNEQLELNLLCQELKAEMYEHQNVVLYNQFRFDLQGSTDTFVDLFNKQYAQNDKFMSIALLHQNVILARELYIILTAEYDQMCEIEYRLDLNDRQKQREYKKVQRVNTIQIVYDVFDCYLATPEQFVDEFANLFDKCIDIGICRYENNRMYRQLVKVFMAKDGCDKEIALENLDIEINQFVSRKLQSDLVEENAINHIVNNAYTVDKDQLKPQDDSEIIADPWFDACFEGDLAYIRKNYDIFNRKVDTRAFNLENNQYPGFAGIHYAAINNQIDVIKLLFEAEGGILTEEDVVVNAFGIGYGEQFLVSCGSNLLQLVCLCDEPEAFELVVELATERNLLGLYMKSNSRGLNNLFVAALCWRSTVGEKMLKTPFCTKLITQAFQSDFAILLTKSPIDVVQMTNSVYFARMLSEEVKSSQDFKNKFYMLVLNHNMSKIYRDNQKVQFGTDAERDYVSGWLNAVYEDAITHAVENTNEIQWVEMLRQNLGRNMDAIIKEYARYGLVISNQCEIEVDELIRQELLNAQKTMYSRINMPEKSSKIDKTSENQSLTTTFMGNTSLQQRSKQSKTFMTKKEIMDKTTLMKEKIDQANKEPKWVELERLYQSIIDGSADGEAETNE